jgi:pilus assembly protein Flp/PilA
MDSMINKIQAASIQSFVRSFVRDEQGQDIVEYSLLLVLIGAAAVFVLTTMGTSITSIFSKIGSRLENANQAIS